MLAADDMTNVKPYNKWIRRNAIIKRIRIGVNTEPPTLTNTLQLYTLFVHSRHAHLLEVIAWCWLLPRLRAFGTRLSHSDGSVRVAANESCDSTGVTFKTRVIS